MVLEGQTPPTSLWSASFSMRQLLAAVVAVVLVLAVYMVVVSTDLFSEADVFAEASDAPLCAHQAQRGVDHTVRDCDTLYSMLDVSGTFLGAGKLKKVYLGCMNGEEVAVAVPQPDRVGDPDFASGAERMEELQDIPGVVPLRGYCEETGRETIVTKYLARGPVAFRKWPRWLGLEDWRRTQALPLDIRLSIAYDIAKIVHDVHHHPDGVRIICDWGVDQFSMDDRYRVYFTDLDHMPMLGPDGTVECSPKRFVNRFGLHPTYAPEQAVGYMGPKYESFKMAAMMFRPMFQARSGYPAIYRAIDDLVAWCTQEVPDDRPSAFEVMKSLAAIKSHLLEVVSAIDD